MTDLYEEIARKCSYEIGKAREAVSRLPTDAPDKVKADAVRDAFISNGGAYKFFDWLNCENIEDRLEKVADRLEMMVGDDHVCKG